LELLIAILVLPGLGGLMLLCRHWLLSASSRGSGLAARRLLAILGWITLGFAVGFAVRFAGSMLLLFASDPFSPQLLLSSAVRLFISLILAYAGLAALRVSAVEESTDVPLGRSAQQSRDRDALLLGIVLMIGLPLLIPGAFVAVVLWAVGGMEYAAMAMVQRGRQNRLLWTLLLAVRHDRSLPDEVEVLAHSEGLRQRRRLQHLVNALRQGTPLSAALLSGPALLPLEMGAAIQAGEDCGRLEQVLSELALRQTREVRSYRWGNSLNSILLYLSGMLLMMVMVVSFLMYYIVPKYKAIMADFAVELPPVTVALIQFSDLFASYWFIIVPLLALPFLLLFQWMSLSMGQVRGIPWFVRGFWPRLGAPMVLRSLAAAATAREELAPVMESLAGVIREDSARQRYRRIGGHLCQGTPLSRALLGERLITSRESKVLERAEQLHHLPWALEAMADRIEFLRWRRAGIIAEWLKPIGILCIGGFVLFICLGMFSPLVKMLLDLS
jgi:protein transport protein HofC